MLSTWNVTQWKPSRELFNQGREDCCRNRLRAFDLHLALRRVGQKLDVPDALLQLVERDRATLEERVTVNRRFNTSSISIEQPDAENVLKVRYDFRYGGLRNSKLYCGLGHAAATHNSKECIQVPQAQAAADISFPVDPFRHIDLVMKLEELWELFLYDVGLSWQ